MKKKFNCRGRLFIRKDNSTRYHIRSRKVFEFLKNLGFPVGKKGPTLQMPKIILSNNKLSLARIRGLWNTDGSIYRRYTKQYKNHARLYDNYLVMELKMTAPKLIRQVREILELNKIQTTNIFHRHNFYVLKVCKQEAISQYFNLINFSNPHHFNRLKRFIAETDSLKCFADALYLSGPVAQPGRAADGG